MENKPNGCHFLPIVLILTLICIVIDLTGKILED